MLKEEGEDVNLKDNTGKCPLLDFIINTKRNGRTADVTSSLLRFLNSIGVDCNATDRDGRNILHYTFFENGRMPYIVYST